MSRSGHAVVMAVVLLLCTRVGAEERGGMATSGGRLEVLTPAAGSDAADTSAVLRTLPDGGVVITVRQRATLANGELEPLVWTFDAAAGTYSVRRQKSGDGARPRVAATWDPGASSYLATHTATVSDLVFGTYQPVVQNVLTLSWAICSSGTLMTDASGSSRSCTPTNNGWYTQTCPTIFVSAGSSPSVTASMQQEAADRQTPDPLDSSRYIKLDSKIEADADFVIGTSSIFYPRGFVSGLQLATSTPNVPGGSADARCPEPDCSVDKDPHDGADGLEGPDGNCLRDREEPTPIVVDVDGNGIELTSLAGGVVFDLDTNGVPERLSWTAPGGDDGWLVRDRNGNGAIDDGTELFGNYTSAAANGYLALAELDADGNGRIDAADAVWSALRVWIDRDHNGLSSASELVSLDELSITALDLRYRESKRRDRHGNWFRYRAKIHGGDAGRWTYDVYLLTD